MPTYIMVTKLTPGSLGQLRSVEEVGRDIGERVKAHAAEVKWLSHYALLGRYDFLDVFEAPNESVAAEVSLLTAAVGSATTETWTAIPYDRFVQISKEAAS
jgi:uncharacterized protein with GYD domain